MKNNRKRRLLAATLLIFSGVGLSLAAQEINSLIFTGHPGSAKVAQIGGRNYVDVEGLAQLTQGSISFNGNQIVMTWPGGAANAPAPTAGFSKDFVTAGIEEMSEIREWRAALKNAIERSYPLTGDWLTGRRAEAQQALRLASLAVSTTSDKNALPFLTNEFNNMSALSNKYLQMNLVMTYIAPTSLDSDSLNLKITTCAHSLASMATSNQFVDDGSCR